MIFNSYEKEKENQGLAQNELSVVVYLLIFCIDLTIQNWCGLTVMEVFGLSLNSIGTDIYNAI